MIDRLKRFLSTSFICTALGLVLMVTALTPVEAKAAPISGGIMQAKNSAVISSGNSVCVNTKVIREGHLKVSGDKIRYKRSNGSYLKKRWKTINGSTYYFNKNGFAVKGLKKIGKSYYIFNGNGVLQKGWVRYGTGWYYADPQNKGKLHTSWLNYQGKWYYLSVKTHYMLTGYTKIGKKWYYFDSSGAMITTSRNIDGYSVVINSDGSIKSRTLIPAKPAPAPKAASAGSSNGLQVANFAVQFVGNPYKWGGSSLTKGADCSGFVMAVYSHFGVQLPHYDASIRQRGTAVNGLANARPGDVICYNGHVAIYLGGGRIVHAASTRQGICIGNNAAYTKILSIRRFL